MSATKTSKKHKKRRSRSLKGMMVSSAGQNDCVVENTAAEPIRPFTGGKLAERGDTEKFVMKNAVSCKPPTKCSQTEISIPREISSFKDQLIFMGKDDQLKALNDKLHQTTLKLFDARNSNSSLKQELNKAQKLLCSEIGENVTIAELSNHPNGWRGRAEQIHQLQQKVSELQQKLNGRDRSRQPSLSSSATDRRSSSNLKLAEKERKNQIDSMMKELKITEMALEHSKKKLEMSKLRIKGLENDLASSKRNLMLMNEKRTHDDQLIEALNDQIKRLQKRNEELEMDIQRQRVKTEMEMASVKNELGLARVHADQFKDKLDQREKEMENMKSSQPTSKERLGLRTPLQSQDENTNSPRCHNDPNEYLIIGMAAEAEREKLLELITVLNRRLEKERHDVDRLSESLRLERNRSAKLETKVQKMELDRVGASKYSTGYKKQSIKSTQSADDPDSEETRYRLELLQEECLALKDRLALVQQDKLADLVAFKQMLEQSRKIFQDAYR